MTIVIIPAPLIDTHPRLHDWTKSLTDNIWEVSLQRTCSGVTFTNHFPSRVLEAWEWNRIWKLMNSGRVILTVSDVWGFVLQVSLWSYPSSTDSEMVHLISVTNQHVKDMKSGLNAPSGGLWELISPITHGERNKKAVELFLPDRKLKTKESYAY